MEKIIRRFNANKVKYLVIGGQAIRLMGMPRYSMDWDIFIPGTDIENINKINDVLSDILDMELEPLGDKGQNFVQTFQTFLGLLQFHLAPIAIPPFLEAEKKSVVFCGEDGIDIRCISPDDLYNCKKKIHRSKDEDDIEYLKHLLQL